MQMTYETIGALAWIKLNRPPVNALNLEMLREYVQLLRRAGADDTIRGVFITSMIDGIFSAGIDLMELREVMSTNIKSVETLYREVTRAQEDLGKPSMALIDGVCRGGGVTMAIGCDMAIATENSTFGYAEIKAGLLPSIHFTHLPKVIGRARSFYYLFSGEPMSAMEAAEMGIINRSCKKGDLDKEGKQMMEKITRHDSEVIKYGRRDYRAAVVRGSEGEVHDAIVGFSRVTKLAAAREGVVAFLEKREPRWE